MCKAVARSARSVNHAEHARLSRRGSHEARDALSSDRLLDGSTIDTNLPRLSGSESDHKMRRVRKEDPKG